MGRFTLPSKISKWTLVKIFMTSVLTLTGYYFYPTIENNKKNSDSREDWTEVLQAASLKPTPVYTINSYVMKDVIRPDCDKDQPFMDFFCRKTEVSTSSSGVISTKISRAATFGVNNAAAFSSYLANKNSTSTSIEAGIEFYTNPVLEEISGVPVLAYYGGLYEVVLDQNPQRVVNLTRTFKTVGDVGYTAGCANSWFPSNLGKKGNTLVFGSGGLENYLQSRCYNQQKITNGFDTGWGTTVRGDRDCAPMALELGIPTITGCKPDADTSCWKKEYQCKTLNGFTMYYNIPFISRVTFSKTTTDANGSVLRISALGGMKVVPSSGGAATPDAYSFCRGKTKNDCTEMVVELAYGDKQVLRCGAEGCNDYGTYDPPQYNMPVSLGGPTKTFYKRIYSRNGFNKVFQDSNELKFIYGGFDTPLAAFSAKNRVDLFQIDAPFWRGGTNFRKYRLVSTLYDGMLASPAPYLLGLDWNRSETLDVKTGAIQDYVSDKYYFSLQYINNSLVFSRFLVSGFCGDWYVASKDIPRPNPCPVPDTTTYNRISLPGVSLSFLRNVTFSINSNEDIDIMIAPNFKDSIDNYGAQTRMFRAQKFNSPTGTYRLYELTPSNGGYEFPNPSKLTGNNAPLTFRYYNNTDSDINNDYAVFVSRNFVFTSKIPPSPPVCTPNFNLAGGGLSLVNTSPNSMNFGVSPTPDLSTDSSLYDLKFAFNSAVTLSCPSGIVQLPSGTDINLKLFDGLTSNALPNVITTKLSSDRRTFTYSDEELDNQKKYYYQINFTYDGQTYNYPATGVDPSRYFTLESFLNVYTYVEGEFPQPLPDSKLVITKSFKGAERQYSLSAPNGDAQFTLISSILPSFYWDHNLTRAGSILNDAVTYRLCFTNTPDTKVSRIGFAGSPNPSSTSISNNYFTGTINNGCVNLNYKSSTIASYNIIPQEIDVYLATTAIPEPSTYVNFRANGNVMIKNTTDVKIYNATGNDKKYQGTYLASSANGEKGYGLSLFNKNTYFKIPYFSGTSKLTSALNFSWTQDLIYFTEPTTSLVKETGTYLLTDRKTDVSPSNFDKIDVFTNYQSVTPTIIYVAKNKYLFFDLNDTNIFSSLENTYFVSTDGSNTKERIVFYVNCDDTKYSYICTQNYEYHLKGGIYGDFKLTGKLNARNANRSFITIHQNPEILILLQKDLRSNKLFNVTRSKTIFKYLNN